MSVGLTVAVAVHAALGWAFMTQQEAAIDSGAGAQEVRVGTSFADMAVGTLEATETAGLAEVVGPQMPGTVQPDTVQAAVPVEVTPAQQAPPPAAKIYRYLSKRLSSQRSWLMMPCR